MVGPYLNQVGGNVDDDVALFNGGLDTYTDKAFLESNIMPYVMNMTPKSSPGIATRPSRITIAEHMANNRWAENLGKIIDIFTYDYTRFFVIAKKDDAVKLYQVYRPGNPDGSLQPNYKVQELGEIPEENNYYFTIARRANGPRAYITGETFKVKLDMPLTPGQAIPVVVPDPEEPIREAKPRAIPDTGGPGDNDDGGYASPIVEPDPEEPMDNNDGGDMNG